MKTASRHCHFLQDPACLPDGDVFSLVTFAGILCNLPPPTYLPPFHPPVVRPPTPSFWRGKGNKRRRKRRRLKVERRKKKSDCCFDLIAQTFGDLACSSIPGHLHTLVCFVKSDTPPPPTHTSNNINKYPPKQHFFKTTFNLNKSKTNNNNKNPHHVSQLLTKFEPCSHALLKTDFCLCRYIVPSAENSGAVGK